MTFFEHEQFERLRIQAGVTWGRPVRVFDTCASTNDLALAAVHSEARTGIVFLAKQQTKGRGRRGNHWLAEPGACLMCSVMLRVPQLRFGLEGLSLAVGLAIHDTVAPRLSAPHIAQIKWPNDVFVGENKLAGVLIEAKPDTANGWGVVVGIGLNWLTLDFPPELPQATSLALLGAANESIEALLVSLLGHLEKRVGRFLSRGMVELMTEVRAVDHLLGRSIRIDGESGQGAGIDELGRLLLRTPAGLTKSFSSGHVEFANDSPTS